MKYLFLSALGIGLGLLYGWVIDPADFFDLTPDTLRADYKADYVLMTAEAYRATGPGPGRAPLAIFGSQSPPPSPRMDWLMRAQMASLTQISPYTGTCDSHAGLERDPVRRIPWEVCLRFSRGLGWVSYTPG